MPATPRLLDDQCQQQHNMLTEFQSFYVEDLEQFLLNAEQALHRELQAAQMELHYHQVQHRTDLYYWVERGDTSRRNYIQYGLTGRTAAPG